VFSDGACGGFYVVVDFEFVVFQEVDEEFCLGGFA